MYNVVDDLRNIKEKKPNLFEFKNKLDRTKELENSYVLT